MPSSPPVLPSNADRLARRAAAIGHPSRARMLLALLDAQAHSAGTLAGVAEVAAATASAHLTVLVEVGLIARASAGRQRLYRIASPEVAAALETLLRLDATRARHMSMHPRPPLHLARTCYDHLAGRLGVRIAEAMLDDGALTPCTDERYLLTSAGERRLARLGIDSVALRTRRRAFATACIDWTERQPHVGGALGAAICTHLLEARWVTRMPGSRALQVGDQGWRALRQHFGITREDIEAAQPATLHTPTGSSRRSDP